ncbi:DUF4430 domain-containing protein [Chloroflexota bacterium]
MKPIKLLALIAIFLLVSTATGACTTQTSESTPSSGKETGAIMVKVVVTQNFGQELMLDETLEVLPDTSAMTALMEVAEVETAYGGGFVNAINGVRSGFTGGQSAKRDWFFYMNGIQSNIGALDYKLHDGDVQHWDFHSWSFRHFIPAIIDGFPAPFQYGFGGKVSPNLIVCQDSLKGNAEKLEKKLIKLGVNNISLRSFSELAENEKESSNLVFVGLPDNNLISELNQNWQRLGFFAYFEDGNLTVIDIGGEVTAKYDAGAGVIQVTQNPWNPKGIGACENVVCLVSGTDEDGVENALDALINHYGDFQYAGAVVVADGEIIKVPQ